MGSNTTQLGGRRRIPRPRPYCLCYSSSGHIPVAWVAGEHKAIAVGTVCVVESRVAAEDIALAQEPVRSTLADPSDHMRIAAGWVAENTSALD